MIVFQPKGKKDDIVDKEEEVPKVHRKKSSQPNLIIYPLLFHILLSSIYLYFLNHLISHNFTR